MACTISLYLNIRLNDYVCNLYIWLFVLITMMAENNARKKWPDRLFTIEQEHSLMGLLNVPKIFQHALFTMEALLYNQESSIITLI
jgi:hypothetical protein